MHEYCRVLKITLSCHLSRALSPIGAHGYLQNPHIRSQRMLYVPRRRILSSHSHLFADLCISILNKHFACFTCRRTSSEYWCASADLFKGVFKHVGSHQLGLENRQSHFDERTSKRSTSKQATTSPRIHTSNYRQLTVLLRYTPSCVYTCRGQGHVPKYTCMSRQYSDS